METEREVHQGQMYYANLSPVTGSEQGGIRPVVIVQGEAGNRFSPTLTVVPLTKVPKKPNQPTHVLIRKRDGMACDSMALCEQMRTIDTSRLISPMGEISQGQLKQIQAAIKVHLGIKNDK